MQPATLTTIHRPNIGNGRMHTKQESEGGLDMIKRDELEKMMEAIDAIEAIDSAQQEQGNVEVETNAFLKSLAVILKYGNDEQRAKLAQALEDWI